MQEESTFSQPCGNGRLPLPMAALPILLTIVITGCSEQKVEFTEVKRIDERLESRELAQLLRISRVFPGRKFPDNLVPFAALPDWQPTRTLPVRELLHEEQHSIDHLSSTEYIAKQFRHHTALQRVLRQEKLTTEQFVGLVQAFGVAMSRTRLPEQQELSAIMDRGTEFIAGLEGDSRPFSSLSPEARYVIVQRAGWLTRMDRAERLQLVSPENMEFVTTHGEHLVDVLPPAFLRNPFDGLLDQLEEYGVPFRETAATGFDHEITWDPEDAVIGREVSSRAAAGAL